MAFSHHRLLTILLALALFLNNFFDCSNGESVEALHRKLIVERERMRKREEMKVEGMARQEKWELRRVPAGPDPLHHNGRDPNTPRTTP